MRGGGTRSRRVLLKARVVRMRGVRNQSAPLGRHLRYLQRDGTTRDGAEGQVFDGTTDRADSDAFASRCGEDRHHFRFIVSPEDAADMADLRTFTRELMEDVARDLETRLDWVAIDHWNTDNPHVHILLRGVADDGSDLVIDKSYIGHGMRLRAEERVTAELGPRTDREIEASLLREVEAERWTGLDRQLASMCDDRGEVDLRPEPEGDRPGDRRFLLGRAQVLERLGLAERTGPALWKLADDLEPSLRALGDRGDIIRTLHRAMAGEGGLVDASQFWLHPPSSVARVVGRLVERGLHDELAGEAYAIVEGLDGRTHHLLFSDIARTGDAAPGAIVETGTWTDRKGHAQAELLVRSDWTIDRQVTARGATWLDRQLLSRQPEELAGSFGDEVREALARRLEVLRQRGLVETAGQRQVFADDLLATLRGSELAAASAEVSARHGLAAQDAVPGDQVAGIYRERLSLASGRFAVIEEGEQFRLVPWRHDLDRRLGEYVEGRVNQRGTVDWSFTRARQLEI